MDVASLADLLRETAEHHDPYEKSHRPHNWWDWYAAYMTAREHGNTSDEASGAAERYIEEEPHVARALEGTDCSAATLERVRRFLAGVPAASGWLRMSHQPRRR